MKKIYLLLLLLILLIFITGCTDPITIINITYISDDNKVTFVYNEPVLITSKEIEFVTELEVENIYYDKDYTLQYDNELISEDTTIYIKTKVNNEESNLKLSKELYDQILSDYMNFRFEDMYANIYKADVTMTRMLGIYNGKVVCSFNSEHMVQFNYDSAYISSGVKNVIYENLIADITHKEIIDDVEVWYNNTNTVVVWDNGDFYILKEAYKRNLISHDDLIDIANKLKEEVDISKINEARTIESLFDSKEIVYLLCNAGTSNCVFMTFNLEKGGLEFYNTFLKDLKVVVQDQKKFTYDDTIEFALIKAPKEPFMKVSSNGDIELFMFGVYLYNTEDSKIDYEAMSSYLAERVQKVDYNYDSIDNTKEEGNN